MNRIDHFVNEHDIELSYYIFITDNIENEEWGDDWFKSLYTGFKASKTTIISNDVYVFLLGDEREESSEILAAPLYVVMCIKEPRLYMPSSVIFPHTFFTKSGTSLNFASQLAMLLRPKELHFYGVDLGWKTTSSVKQNDPNHYHTNYFARINSGFYENARMHHVHDKLIKLFHSQSIVVKNFSPRTIVECYDVYDINTKKLTSEGFISKGNALVRLSLTFYDETRNDFKRLVVKILKFLGIK
jgi:hypothetical protein